MKRSVIDFNCEQEQVRSVKKILIIDDHEPMRRNVMLILEMEGFSPVAAANGREGIERAQKDRPDLILCDISMPGLDGYEVLQGLREDKVTASIPFIFLTAKGEKLDIRMGMNYGADDYLTKPVGHQELLAAIEARLERKRMFDAEAKEQVANVRFAPDFSSSRPLEELGLTPREAEVLLWVAQGKSNADIGIITNTSEKTIKNHMTHIFEKLGIESRNAATVRALEILSKPVAR